MSCSPTPDLSSPAGSCRCESAVFDGASPVYRRALITVIGINIVGFVGVAAGAAAQGSSALGANALDFLGDAATYALSLWAIGRAAEVRAGAALVKGASLTLLAASVIGLSFWRLMTAAPLDGAIISGLGLFGMLANLAAAALLLRWRDGDANVRSVWICTRNDVIHCIAVILAGGLVALTGSRWPDVLVGGVLAAIFLRSAWLITAHARAELRQTAQPSTWQVAPRTRARS